ncbi:hypothetical protein LTR95_017521 [Oleoguttula sp. CCFEE 5521]
MGPDVAAHFERSIPHWQGKFVVKQLLTALKCLHDLGIAHSDTNPGNLLLSLADPIANLSPGGRSIPAHIRGNRNPHAPKRIYEDRPLTEFWDPAAPAELKLSDFGAAFPFHDPPERPIIAVALRAPEVVLQTSFDHRIDIWSFGCYLFEVFTGQALFELPPFYPMERDDDHLQQTTGKDDCHMQQTTMKDDDHLLEMISALGPLPSAMFETWPRRMRYFDENLKIIRTDVEKSEIPIDAVYIGDTLEQRIQNRMPMSMTAKEGADLTHAVRSALQYDSTKRPSAADLLSLDWFQCT